MAVGDPTGEDLCVGATDGDTLPEYGDEPGWEEREITFVSPVELTSGVKYAVVVRATSRTGEAEVYWSIRVDNPTVGGNVYRSINSGGSWTSYATQDAWFKTKANGVEKDDGSFEADEYDRATSAYDTRWKAETFTAGSTYTISSIILKLSKSTIWGGTVEDVTVSIKATIEAPRKPTNPSPANEATDITLDETPLSWDASDPAADTYEVYFREQGNDWELVGEAQAGIEWAIDFGTLAYDTTYEWRIDATNEYGTTTGDTWSFTTIDFDQIRISYRLISGGSGAGPYDDPPGTEGTDWAWTGESNIITVKKLVAAANNKIWYEAI